MGGGALLRKRWFRQILRRRVFVILLLVIQGLVLIGLISNASQLALWVDRGFRLLSVLVGLRVVSSRDKPTYKLLWIVLFLVFPVFGGLLYLLVSFQRSTRWAKDCLERLEQDSRPLLKAGGAYDAACRSMPERVPQLRYLQAAGFPVYGSTTCDFFSPGEQVFAALLPELEKAERYIFLEFFIIQEGGMWNAIHDILREKARRGVTVRVLYDDLGSFLTLPKDYASQLEREGIQCRVFNPFRPVLSSIQNNRDHRKIVSIDGKVAFTGGFNLADEYINAIEKHGHWKDAGIRLRGDAAWSLTLMFLQMWGLASRTQEDLSQFLPSEVIPDQADADGFVQPYADSPLDKENTGEHVYLQIINNAKQYVYINTPYLIVDDSMVSALSLAAKSGVDVRIVTPHHWDKWVIHMTTRAYYRSLLEAGVKVYEYTPGFLHAKTFVSDDEVATVGTINLDYRSLYLHFECGTVLYRSRAVEQVKDDFLRTLEVCQEVTLADCRHRLPFRIFQEILRLFAPLM